MEHFEQYIKSLVPEFSLQSSRMLTSGIVIYFSCVALQPYTFFTNFPPFFGGAKALLLVAGPRHWVPGGGMGGFEGRGPQLHFH